MSLTKCIGVIDHSIRRCKKACVSAFVSLTKCICVIDHWVWSTLSNLHLCHWPTCIGVIDQILKEDWFYLCRHVLINVHSCCNSYNSCLWNPANNLFTIMIAAVFAIVISFFFALVITVGIAQLVLVISLLCTTCNSRQCNTEINCISHYDISHLRNTPRRLWNKVSSQNYWW